MPRNTFKLLVTTLLLGTVVSFAMVMHAAEYPTILVCDIWPPYQIQERNKVEGLSTEIIQAVYKRMDTPVDSINAFPWKRALRILQSGHADALFSANYTKDRETFAHYPEEILFESPWVIWTKGSGNIKTLEDLKGKTIGVVMGYSYTKSFWDFIQTYCRVEQVTTDNINFKKLALGRLDAIVAEYGNGKYLIKQLNLEGLSPHQDIVIKKDGLHIIFSRDRVDKEFVQRFSDELKAFKTTQEYQDLRYKYLDEKPAP